MPRRSFLAAGFAFVLDSCARGGRRSSASSALRTTTTSPAASTSTTSTSTSPSTVAGAKGPARFVTSGSPTSGTVALTFHGSGDVALLRQLLDAAGSAPLTIFAVGNWLDANPTIARTILDRGHELANHTYTHPVLPRLDRAKTATEITGCRDSLVRHTGSAGRWFRPSGTPTPTPLILEEAARAGYDTVVGYDVDPLDYRDPGAAAVTKAAIAGLHAGAIVSLHTGHAGTVTALPEILRAVAAKGLRPVTVHDLLDVR